MTEGSARRVRRVFPPSINARQTRGETLMMFESVDAIKQAVDDGREVRWGNDSYRVIKDSLGQYLIEYAPNGSCIGLTWRDGVTLNGKLGEFYEPPSEAQ